MTRDELRQFVRDLTLVGEHEASDSLVDTFLLEGYHKVISRDNWSWMLQPSEVITPTSSPYDLTTLTLSPTAITDLATVNRLDLPLTQVTRTQATFFRHAPLTGRTRLYYIEGNLLYLDPPSDGSVDYEISYFADQGWPAGDVAPGALPELFHTSILGNYAVHRLWERQEDFDRSDAYLGRFEIGLADMTYMENTRNADGPKIMGEIAGNRGRNHMPWLDRVG